MVQGGPLRLIASYGSAACRQLSTRAPPCILERREGRKVDSAKLQGKRVGFRPGYHFIAIMLFGSVALTINDGFVRV